MELNSLLKVKVTADVETQIVAENARHKLTRAVLNPGYITFMNYLVLRSEPCVMDDYKMAKRLNLQDSALIPERKEAAPNDIVAYQEALQKWKFLFTYALTSLLRVTLKSAYPTILCHLRKAVQSDFGISLWLLETFSHPRLLYEFLVTCPVSESRFFVASLLSAAFGKVFSRERKRVAKYSSSKNQQKLYEKLSKKGELKPLDLLLSDDTPGNKEPPREAYFLPCLHSGIPYALIFANNLLALLPKALANRQSISQYAFLLSSLARNRPEMIAYFLLNDVAGLLLEVLSELHGERVVQANKQKFILVSRAPSLGFQHTIAPDKDRQQRIQVTYIRPKQFRFVLELMATVNLCHSLCL